MKNIELVEIVGGALQEQFARSFESVLENLQNPNTSFKAPREITIKLKFTQSERRDDAKCAISVSEKLAPQAPMETAFAIGRDLKTGELYAEEYGNQLKMRVDEPPEVDTETGEVIEKSVSIIDLRKTARA
ncbi:MAG: hypothetical protein IJF28_05035 [Firmicutes bacterium]|nr:hypothetical protein [Bacillota bacterium]